MGPVLATAGGGLGSGLQQAGIEAQQRKSRNILSRQLDRSAKVQADGAQQVMQEGQAMAPAARLAAMQAAEDAAAARTQQDTAGANLETAAGGAVSGDFLRAKADRALAEGDRRTAIARELAKVRSVGDTQQAEALRRSSLAEALQSMYRSNAADAQAAELDADAVGMPWYGQLGALINAGGRAASGGRGGWIGG